MFAPRVPPRAAPEGRAGNLQLEHLQNAAGREPLCHTGLLPQSALASCVTSAFYSHMIRPDPVFRRTVRLLAEPWHVTQPKHGGQPARKTKSAANPGGLLGL